MLSTEDSSFFLDALNEDYTDGLYMSPQEWELLIQRLKTAQFLLPKPGAKTPEPGSPSSSTDPQEVDPHEDLRRYIPKNPDVDLSLPLKQSTYSASVSSFTTSLIKTSNQDHEESRAPRRSDLGYGESRHGTMRGRIYPIRHQRRFVKPHPSTRSRSF